MAMQTGSTQTATMRTATMQTGAEVLVESLAHQGVEKIFGVPGESYLAVLDALVGRGPDFVLCRQEGGAAFMAEAWGKLTGRPGICFVTRGPGATNASIGVHTARQNSTPMILFVGQIEGAMRDREAFQEVDYRAVFGGLAKWATEIDRADRVGEVVARAFHVAMAGRPGPVVVALPEEVLTDRTGHGAYRHRIAPPWPGIDAGAVQAAHQAIAGAERPVALVSGGGWRREPERGMAALGAFTAFAERAGMPIVVGFRGQDLVDNESPAYVGDAGFGMGPHVREALAGSDLILALNARFGETATDGYTLFDLPEPRQRLIHVHPSDGELGKVYQTPHGVHGSPVAFLEALTAEPLEATGARSAWMAGARAKYEASFTLPPQPGGLDLGAVMAHLRDRLPRDAVLTTGAGNFAIWPTRLFRFRPGHRLLGPQSGAMGAGLPAAVAAKIADPARMVVCFTGDGDIQMTMQELGTAMQAGAMPIVMVFNNGTYGTIRMHQEREYPGRVSATDLVNPDFCAIARAYGMLAERVAATGEFAGAFERAAASASGALLELMVDKEAITPARTLSQVRAAAEARS